MNVSVRYNGMEKEIKTAINFKNCFDVKNNVNAADHQLPLLYHDSEGEDYLIGTVDDRSSSSSTFFVINIAPVEDDIYSYIWANIENMKLLVKKIEGDHNGYLFIIEM